LAPAKVSTLARLAPALDWGPPRQRTPPSPRAILTNIFAKRHDRQGGPHLRPLLGRPRPAHNAFGFLGWCWQINPPSADPL